MDRHTPLTVSELKQRRQEYLKSLHAEKKKVSVLDRLALWITVNVGSMRFFVVIFIWTVGWLCWNMFAPKSARFDPYPAFVLWLFISNMIQLFLMPLIMIGQNVLSKHDDARAEADFKINMLAAVENETILMHLERQAEQINQILKHLEKEVASNTPVNSAVQG